jgi:hypothetical protein
VIIAGFDMLRYEQHFHVDPDIYQLFTCFLDAYHLIS